MHHTYFKKKTLKIPELYFLSAGGYTKREECFYRCALYHRKTSNNVIQPYIVRRGGRGAGSIRPIQQGHCTQKNHILGYDKRYLLY